MSNLSQPHEFQENSLSGTSQKTTSKNANPKKKVGLVNAFTNVSKNLRKSTLVNPKIYVIFWAPKFTSFGDSG